MTENKQFLTIQEAVIFTGKSEKTIRRLVKRLSNEQAKNEDGYPPIKLDKKGKYFISKEFLTSQFYSQKPTLEGEQIQGETTQKLIQKLEVEIEFLKNQIKNQQEQMKIKDEQIRDLTETLKTEQEITINQQKLSLTDKGIQNTKKGFWGRLLGN